MGRTGMANDAVTRFDMKVAHIGINASFQEEAAGWATEFLTLMGFSTRETPVSYFADDLVEIMKENGRGVKGHIGFSVNDCESAAEYFASRGMRMIEETKKYDESGHMTFVYFEEQIGGFAIHLVEKAS